MAQNLGQACGVRAPHLRRLRAELITRADDARRVPIDEPAEGDRVVRQHGGGEAAVGLPRGDLRGDRRKSCGELQ